VARAGDGEGIHPSVWTGLALFLCAALLGAALGGALRVRRVVVVGNGLPVSAIVQAAGVQGENIFAVRSDQVVARVAQVPQIVVDRVEVSFPDRVTIYARLRVPVVAVQAPGGLYRLDANGAVIDRIRVSQLPVISEPEGARGVGPGVVAAVRYAVQALAAVPGGSIKAFRYTTGNGLSIVGSAGWTAALGAGPPQAMVDRVGTLAALLRKIQSRPDHLKFVDLRLSAPYAKFGNP
jgi:cell division septal protein FtsQ